MTFPLRPETQAKLEAMAATHGLSAGDYLEVLVERELLIEASEAVPSGASSGMIEKDGLRVYRTGKPLPTSVIDHAIRRAGEERSLQLLGRH